MILSETIPITISNNGSYYKELGYGECKQGQILNVKIQDLPQNSNKNVSVQCDYCPTIFERSYQMITRSRKLYEAHLCKSCARLEIGRTMDYSHIRELNRDRTREKHPRWRTDRSEYSEYHAQVYSLTRRTYKNNKEVLNPLDLPFGRCGVDGAYQLDHKISIKRGYELGLSAESLAGVDNLQVLPWKENRTKWFYDLSEDHK